MGDFAGLTADGWIAIATFFSGTAVLIGALGVFWQIRRVVDQQEATDTRRYLLDEGVLALKEAIDRLLERTRRNYAIVVQLIVLVRERPVGHPFAPRAQEIPSLLPDLPVIKFESIGAASRLLNCMEIGELATTAFAELYSVNIGYEFSYRQPVVNYYSGVEWSSADRSGWCTKASEMAEARYNLVEEYGHLAHALGEAALRAQELRLSRFSDLVKRIHPDPTIQRLAKVIREIPGRIEEKKKALPP